MVGGSCCRIIPLWGPTCKIAIFHAEQGWNSQVGLSVAKDIHWVLAGPTYRINATLWPNLQMRTWKNSSQVEFHVGPSVAILASITSILKKLHYITQTPSKYNPDTLQTFARNITNIIHATSRHFPDIFQTTSKHPPNTYNCKGNHQQQLVSWVS